MSLANRALRPYPPVDVDATDLGAGLVDLDWKNRNRTIRFFTRQDDPTQTPETGQTTTLKVYDSSPALIDTITGLTGTTYTYTYTGLADDLTFKFFSSRDGYESTSANEITIPVAGSAPAEVQAFALATGITDNTIIVALTNLFNDMTSAGLWSKMYAIYPIVGGTASTHKFNFKDPQDLDASFRLSFTGSITHNASGMTGSSAYGNTHLNPSTDIPTNEGSFGMWMTGLGTGQASSAGCRTTGNKLFFLAPHFGDGNAYYGLNGAQGSVAYITNWSAITEDFVQGVRQNSGNSYTQIGTTRITYSSSYDSPNVTAYLMAENNAGTPSLYSTRTWKFAYIGRTLTTTEMDAYRTIVAAFQTDLGR